MCRRQTRPEEGRGSRHEGRGQPAPGDGSGGRVQRGGGERGLGRPREPHTGDLAGTRLRGLQVTRGRRTGPRGSGGPESGRERGGGQHASTSGEAGWHGAPATAGLQVSWTPGRTDFKGRTPSGGEQGGAGAGPPCVGDKRGRRRAAGVDTKAGVNQRRGTGVADGYNVGAANVVWGDLGNRTRGTWPALGSEAFKSRGADGRARGARGGRRAEGSAAEGNMRAPRGRRAGMEHRCAGYS